ncbi:MAG TPA: hypothetical protein VK095_09585 [Beutenbergiaceae bacterium]|nr:hypothetical protein [Beutenbergiaceae bacterium]
MLRRSILAAAVTVVLVIGGGAVAYALWSVTEPLPEMELSTGSFEVEAGWTQAPDVTDLFPGDSAVGRATVELDSSTTWQYAVDYHVEGPLAGHLQATWYAADQCDGAALNPGELNGTTLAGGTATEFCIQFTLAADAPAELQGQRATVQVDVTAQQVQS